MNRKTYSLACRGQAEDLTINTIQPALGKPPIIVLKG